MRAAALGLLFALGIFSSVSAANFEGNLVPDSSTAIQVATIILKRHLGPAQFQKFVAKSPLRARETPNAWIVFTYPKMVPPKRRVGEYDEYTVVAGGGGPAISIAKKDGQILDLYFQK
jgi:hypothetical protein